jgi:hypothetical protein
MARRPITPPLQSQPSHGEIVRHFILHKRGKLHTELARFAQQASFPRLLDEAVHARDHRGKRLSHQRRLARHVIPKAFLALKAISTQLQHSSSFDDLLHQIERALSEIPGAGDLYFYDTALRIGAFLGLYPTRVFLQTGALKGALRLSSKYRRRSTSLAEFPVAFRALAPFEMENLLCIYESVLRA